MTTSWDNKVRVQQAVKDGVARPIEMSMADFYKEINTYPEGIQRIRKDVTVDLTNHTEAFKNAISIPAGAIVRYVAAKVLTAVTGGGTTVKLGIGVNDGDVDKWLSLATLTAGTKGAALIVDGSAFSAGETLDVNGIVTDLSALGDTDLTAGTVRVVVVYDVPGALD